MKNDLQGRSSNGKLVLDIILRWGILFEALKIFFVHRRAFRHECLSPKKTHCKTLRTLCLKFGNKTSKFLPIYS